MATSPKLYGPTALSLAAAGLACEHCRVILEKPIGIDLDRRTRSTTPSARVRRAADLPHRSLSRQGGGAEPDRAALRQRAVRAAVESRSIDHVQITVAETSASRAAAVTTTSRRAARHGAEPHLQLALLSLPWNRRACSRPTRYATRRLKVLRRSSRSPRRPSRQHRARPVRAGAATARACRASRGEGAAKQHGDLRRVKREIENWRWAGVPFYLRTGKRMRSTIGDRDPVSRVPSSIFQRCGARRRTAWSLRLQPDEGVSCGS